MPQLADHQLLALIELTALDRAGDHVGDGSQERHVGLGELAQLRGVRADDAIGTAVAPRDRARQTGYDAMVVQQRRTLEPCFRREVLDDDRTTGCNREAGLRTADRRDVRPAYQVRLPADAGPQHQFGIARHEFEDLDEFDVEYRGDDDGGVV